LIGSAVSDQATNSGFDSRKRHHINCSASLLFRREFPETLKRPIYKELLILISANYRLALQR
jgi:hypothetical protein